MRMILPTSLWTIILFLGQVSSDLSKIYVQPGSGHFVDDLGRVRLFRGINSVIKGPPWYDPKLLNPRRQKELSDLGMNVVRLGAMWTGVQPDNANAINHTYIGMLRKIVGGLGNHGIYSILDMHQDVLWKAGPAGNQSGYWGVPPWVKEEIGPLDQKKQYPWPFRGLSPQHWACGYFTKEINDGFQDIYDNRKSTLDHLANFWNIVASKFKEQTQVLGYELINEPWAGDIFDDISLLLPGRAGAQNLVAVYEKLHHAIREEDSETLIFWEPVTWSYILPFQSNLGLDFIAGVSLKSLGMERLLSIVKHLCGPLAPDDESPLNVTQIMSVVQRVAKDLLIKKEPKKSGAPSVFGPGFSHVPGGDDFLNRTAMSWHYYCWALGQVPAGDEAYDPFLRQVCDQVLGPLTFNTVKQRTKELGGSGSMLTEFGTCLPNIKKQNTLGFIECDFVMRTADKHFQSWIYWDTYLGGTFWNQSTGALLPDVVQVFARPYPQATMGKPLSLSFDVQTKIFQYLFEADESMTKVPTEVFIPEIQYPDNAYRILTSSGLYWNASNIHPRLFLFFIKDHSEKPTTSWIQILPNQFP